MIITPITEDSEAHNPNNWKIKLPNKVIVLGSAPSIKHVDFKDSDYIICTNANILIPNNPAIHIVKDADMFKKNWWEETLKIKCTRIYSRLVPKHIERDYTFDRRLLGKINSQTTISGVAIHMAAILGARKIVLCGIDMLGTNNFNNLNVRNQFDWNLVLPNVQSLIDFLKEKYKIEFTTLTETALKL